ncbi:hypothetical protein AXX17_AT2G25690 [Arabidopsis thaliana]|uniref:Uncharacterized protein n=1 Tax=Arabidopsis thaliana TaxID=3702 RepID=A0A178VV39_ARATH|nr:hypothetical protein AXX17_AT2G25690 [Arabidopsis thaliana]
MSEPCRLNLLCSCNRRNVSETIDTIKNIIATCIRKYMSLEETMDYMQENHKISHHLTKPIWEQLEKENADFFNKYHLIRELARQIKLFNSFLGKQVSLMLENGDFDISTATSDRSELSTLNMGMSALDDTNGLTVNQSQNPNDQQYQFHSCQWPTTTNHIPCTNLGASTIPPAANDQWFPYKDPACFHLGAPIVPPEAYGQLLPYTDPAYYYPVLYSTAAPAATTQWPTSTDFAYTGGPTLPKAPTAAFDHFRDGFGEDIDNSSPNFQQMDPLAAALQTLPDDMLQELYQQCQRQSQLQQNFSLEEQQRLQSKVNNNGLQGVVRPPEKPPQDLYGQCQPQSQLQQNLPVLELQRLEVEYRANNNELQGVIPHQQHHQEQEAMQTQGDPLNRIPVQSEASNHSDSAWSPKGNMNDVVSEREERYQREELSDLL